MAEREVKVATSFVPLHMFWLFAVVIVLQFWISTRGMRRLPTSRGRRRLRVVEVDER